MTIIFSNGIAERMCVLGNTATRADLDSKRINASSILWQEIHREFLGNTTSYNLKLSSDERFKDVDSSVIVTHDAPKLYDMWKDVNQKYVKALARYTQSGTHESDFFGFCDGNLDVMYLRECLNVKPNLTEFVRGGMFERDEFDSLSESNCVTAQSSTESSQSSLRSSTPTPGSKRKAASIASNGMLSKAIESCSDNLSGAIVKASMEHPSVIATHKLALFESLTLRVASLEDRICLVEREGRDFEEWEARLEAMKNRLAAVEDDYQ